ncbi:oligosaccharide flippase family protein [Vibrio sp.]|uniref:oligosaccharide flippase family protein n=1 Tax=Vibrio sp. TaxID=678 RepID=UPI00311F0BE2
MKINSKLLYLLSDIFNKSLPFISVFYITNHIPPSEYGVLELVVSFYILYGFMITLGFDGWMLSKYYKLEESEFLTSVSVMLWSISITSVILISISLFVSIYTTVIFLIGFSCAILNIYTTLLRLKGEYGYAGGYLLLNSSISFIFLIVFFEFFDASLFTRLLGLSITAFITLSIILRKFYIKYYISIGINDIRIIRSIAIFGLPLSLSIVSSWLKGNIDKLYINQLISTTDLGIYSLALQISSVINVICISLNKILQTAFIKKISDCCSIGKDIFIVSLALAFISVLYFIFTKFIIFNFVDIAYSEAILLLPYLLLSFWFGSIVMLINNIFIYYENTKFIFYQVVTIATVHTGLSFFLIQIHMMKGAVYSSVISSFIGLLLTLYFLFITRQSNNI